MQRFRPCLNAAFIAGCIAALLFWRNGALAQVPAEPAAAKTPAALEKLQPWVAPPTNLPPLAVSAIAELFNDGLPDPRGCEYREIKIPEYGNQTIDTHGWVLPEEAGAPRRAIGWNGVIYPVAAVGAPVDLRAEFAVLEATRNRHFRGNGNGWPMSDRGSLAVNSALPIKAAFLLRLGETPLAESLWDAGYAGNEKLQTQDPFGEMAKIWLGRWFDQAIAAYVKGDYPLASAICQKLAPTAAKVKAAAQARGIADPWPDTRRGELLWQLPTLEAEAQRRAKAKPYTLALTDGGESSMPRPEYIARLIRDLEMVSVHQQMNPGQVYIFDDPSVQALSRAGDDAVEPLLKCLREDDRLTRTRYTEGMFSAGPIIPVYEAAYVALFRMLNVSFPLYEGDKGDPFRERDPRHLSREERGALADKIEAVWRKDRGTSPEEKAYRTLQDDNAGAKAWFQAVDVIVQPTDGTFTTYRLVRPTVGGYSLYVKKEPFTPRGESLRSRKNPSVTELMIRRFKQAVQQPVEDSFEGVINQNTLGKFLLSLAAWDGKNCLGELRTLQQALTAKVAHEPPVFNEATIVTVCEKRLELGDRTALEDYVAYLQSLTSEDLRQSSSGASAYFHLMWQRPTEPVIVQAAEEMFSGKASIWTPLLNQEGQRQSGLSSLFKTPLVGMPAFRRELERGLNDKATAGTVTLEKDGRFVGFPDGNSHLYRLDPLAPAAGTKAAYRVCDAYAGLLSLLDGFPECRPYWPLAERDRAVAACREFLHRYGDNFRYQPGDRGLQEIYPAVARIHFPKLDYPATAEDVAQGRAIFSLPGETRQCRLPELPLYAFRSNRETDPVQASTSDADGTSHDVVQYTTEGQLWQAEETLMDGKWERFYGFVGRYQLEKIPAAEIEFPRSGNGSNVTPQISGWIETSIDRPDYGEMNFSFSKRHFTPSDGPLPVQVKIGNFSGFDQAVPAALTLPPDAGSKAVPAGVQLSLAYSEKIPPKVLQFTEPEFDYGPWQELPLRPEVKTATAETSNLNLGPAQKLTVLNVDLRDFFEASRPGSYRLHAVFRVPGQAEGQSNEIIFSVAEPTRQ